jgi:hypothetical protein
VTRRPVLWPAELVLRSAARFTGGLAALQPMWPVLRPTLRFDQGFRRAVVVGPCNAMLSTSSIKRAVSGAWPISSR